MPDQATEIVKTETPKQDVLQSEVKKTTSTELVLVNEKQLQTQKKLDAIASGDEHVNAFTAIAIMLKQMRSDLEGVKRTEQLPRWMRVARVREFKGEGAMNMIATKGVIPITGGFIKVIGFLAELTLKAQELLTQADGGKALLEVGAGMIKTVASDPFFEAVTETVGIENPGANPLKPIGPIVDNAMKIVDKIPDPEDVEIIAKEIYLLLAIEQLELPINNTGKVDTGKILPIETEHLDVNLTGKVRLMGWAIDKGIPCHGLSGGIKITRLGSRRIWESAETALPQKSSLMWSHEEDKIKILEFDYKEKTRTSGSAPAGGSAVVPVLNDIEEANAILTKLEYPIDGISDESVFDVAFAKRLRKFQKMNKIVVNGQLDNATINLLMNLDYEKKQLKRARKYDAAPLDGFDDTKNEAPVAPKKALPNETTPTHN
ncbi:MAG: peptidoglycan-binding protein [Desulfobacterales bacterium]|nr:peptidoglycan-binding protein [Desulfobacterales bacterium]